MSDMEYFAALQKEGTVLRDGDFACVYRFDRWHLLTLHVLNDNKLGIHTLHFMSAEEAKDYLKPSTGPVESYEAVAADFGAEVAAKILKTAEDYLSILERGEMDRGAGFTTDTLHHIQFDPTVREEWVQDIKQMMREGGPGPYLRFQKSYRSMGGAARLSAES